MFLNAQRPTHTKERHATDVALQEYDVLRRLRHFVLSHRLHERGEEHRVIGRQRPQPATEPEPAELDCPAPLELLAKLLAQQPAAETEEEVNAHAAEGEEVEVVR